MYVCMYVKRVIQTVNFSLPEDVPYGGSYSPHIVESRLLAPLVHSKLTEIRSSRIFVPVDQQALMGLEIKNCQLYDGNLRFCNILIPNKNCRKRKAQKLKQCCLSKGTIPANREISLILVAFENQGRHLDNQITKLCAPGLGNPIQTNTFLKLWGD